jgi:hypothetical protein
MLEKAGQHRIPLTCTAGGNCSLPFGYLLPGGRISIDSRHYSEKHTNRPDIGHLLHLFIVYRLIGAEQLRRMRDEIELSLADLAE